MKDNLSFTVRADGPALTVSYASRELKFLGGPLPPAGERFVRALGVFDSFTVAKGQNTLAWISRRRDEVLAAAKDLSESIIMRTTETG